MVRARLEFARVNGRTRLLGQLLPYPFHATRPFYLDAARPDLATLYLQSASGGVYRGDRLALALHAAEGAAAMVTTQASTLVRDCGAAPAVVETHLHLAAESVLLYLPEPTILMPGADIAAVTSIVLPPQAAALCCDAYALHDPQAAGRRFRRLEMQTLIRRPDGHLLVAERGSLMGGEIGTAWSPLGPYAAFGTLLLVQVKLPERSGLVERVQETGCIAGVSDLPNGCGLALRLLAKDGGTLARGLSVACAAGFEAAFGCAPGARRK